MVTTLREVAKESYAEKRKKMRKNSESRKKKKKKIKKTIVECCMGFERSYPLFKFPFI